MKKIQIPARHHVALLCLAVLLLLMGCGGEGGAPTTEPAANTNRTVQTAAGTTGPAMTAEPPEPQTIYKDGSYEGIGYGNNNNPVQVRLEISGDRIVKLEVVSQNDTPDLFGKAWDSIYAALMGQESPDLSQVDAVSGATNSSRGIIDAIKAALYKARR